MLTIHNHFKTHYQGDDDFAIEAEFKITETTDGSRGTLVIKQASAWIDRLCDVFIYILSYLSQHDLQTTIPKTSQSHSV